MRLPDPEHSRIVLIGTSSYTDTRLPDLPAVGKGIEDLKAVLTDSVHGLIPENHCDVLEDEGDIRLIGGQLRRAAAQAEDLLLVYFAGHGLTAGRRHELYLALRHTEWEAPEFNALEYDKLRSAVLNSPAATKVIILDCCFSGRAFTDTMADPATELIGQVDVDGSYVLVSAHRGQVALILPGEDHTAFTGRLLRLFHEGVPGGPQLLTIDDMYQKLRAQMRAEGLPLPHKRGTDNANLLALARNRAFAATAVTGATADRTASNQEALAAPRRVRSSRRLLRRLAFATAVVSAAAIVIVTLERTPHPEPATNKGSGSSASSSTGHTGHRTATPSTTRLITASLPVIVCPTSLGAGDRPAVSLPRSRSVAVPQALAAELSVYTDNQGIMELLAPKGWSCTAFYGADGSGGVTVHPRGEGSSPAAAISGSESSACSGCTLGVACGLFPSATKAWRSAFFGQPCPARPPTAETRVSVAAGIVAFEDPPGVKGDGQPSGGKYPANGVMTYHPSAPDGSWQETCTLPNSDKDVCTEVLNSFVSWYGQR